jgi:hypothetical protein
VLVEQVIFVVLEKIDIHRQLTVSVLGMMMMMMMMSGNIDQRNVEIVH